MTRTRLPVLALLALALLALVPSLAAAAPRWLAPQDLTPAGEGASTPQVVIGNGGVGTMAWVAQTPAGGVVRVARRPPGSATWGAPVDVSAPGAGAVTGLAIDPAGSVGVLWTVPTPGDPSSANLFTSVRTAGVAGFGPAQPIPGPQADVHFHALTGDGLGGFVVAWSAATAPGTGSTAFVSSRPAGGTWGAPEILSAPNEHALVTEAAGANGRVVVAFTAGPVGSFQRTVRVRERPGQAAPWAPETTISGVDARTSEPSIAIGPTGQTLVAWLAATGAAPDVQAAFRPDGTSAWAAPQRLGSGDGVSPRPRAVVEPDGTATVLWTASDQGGVVARTRPPGAGFGAAQGLGAFGASVSPLPGGLGASGPSGGAVAIWAAGGIDGARVVRAAVKPAGDAPFGPAATISAPDSGLGSQVAALGPGGDAVAAWIESAAAVGLTGVLRTADYTERAGPTLDASPVAVRIDRAPRTAVQGSLARLRLAVDGFAEGLTVRLQQQSRGAFQDTPQTVTVNGTAGEIPLRLTFPGKGVFRLAYADRGQPAFSPSITIQIAQPRRALIAAGIRPKAVAVGLGAVWVLTTGEDGQDEVLRLDPRTGRPTGAPTAVGSAVGLAVGPEAVWVSRGTAFDRGIVRLDPATGAIAAEVPVISTGAIGAGPAGVWTVECERSLDPGAPCSEQRVARIEPAINVVSQRFTVVRGADEAATVDGIAVGRRYVWFTKFFDRAGTATRLDPRTGRLAEIGGGAALAAGGDTVTGLAGTGGCGLVTATGVGRLAKSTSVGGVPRYRCTALIPEGTDLWVLQDANTSGIDPADARLNSRLVRLSARTLKPIGNPVTIGLPPAFVDVGEGAVWAASAEEAVVRRIDLREIARGAATPRPPRPPRLKAAWRRPVAVPGSEGLGASLLDLATGNGGRAAAVWQVQRGALGRAEVVTALRPSGARPWGTARRMGPIVTSTFPGGPRVAMNAAGDAVAAWARRGGSLGASSVQAILLGRRARAWSAPATLGEAGTGNLDPDVAIAADGSAVAVWSCLCDAGQGPFRPRVATRAPGGGFGAPAALDAGAIAAVENVRVAASANGGATATWGSSPVGQITAAARPVAGGFTTPVTLVPASLTAAGAGARIAVNDAGQAVAVWVGNGLYAALRGADGTWGAPERIAPPGRYPASGAEVALDGSGNALVAVRAFDVETYNHRVLTIAKRAGEATWEAPFWLSPKGPTEGPPGPSAGEPSLAMNARGDAVVAWSQGVGGSARALARLRPAGRLAWRPLETASGPERGVAAVSASIDVAGAATTAWVARLRGGSAKATIVKVAVRPALRPAA
ncbi:MAG: hypothetical protein QOD86_350 [Miltoncostaeaceae bacterium]|jgi:hypothetical protein|nr:hypothetical protein [Miltoncostaeaceae bacterium]